MNHKNSHHWCDGVVVSVLFALAVVLVGCGSSRMGVYHAEVEEKTPTTTPAPGYRLEEVRAKLAAEPEEIELRANGRFVLRRSGAVIWEGKWRVENDQIYLRAEVVSGTAILPKLQDDKRYRLQADAIVDEGRYSTYGLQVVYRKK